MTIITFSKEQLKEPIKLDAYEMRSMAFLINGKGGFIPMPLPMEAQFSPVYAICANDFDGDGKIDLLIGGNFYQSKPEVGIYNASYGLYLRGKGNGEFKATSLCQSGFFVKGAIRDITTVQTKKNELVVAARNNDNTIIFNY